MCFQCKWWRDQIHSPHSVYLKLIWYINFTQSDLFIMSNFSYLLSVFILYRLITLWCLRASSSTDQVTFFLLWSHCFCFWCCERGFVVIWAMRWAIDGFKHVTLTGWTCFWLAFLVYLYEPVICFAKPLFWRKKLHNARTYSHILLYTSSSVTNMFCMLQL